MKISYSNYPILESIQKKTLGNLYANESDKDFFNSENIDIVRKIFNDNSNYFSKHITILSKPFIEAVYLATEKLKLLRNEIGYIDISGTYIIGDNIFLVNSKDTKSISEICILQFNKMSTILMIASNEKMWVSNFVKSYAEKIGIEPYNMGGLSFETITNICLFKKYAQVETKYLKPNSKLKDIDCKYVNDTKLNLCFLDSKWFTTLVKSDGFKVRGHFRLQPYGAGMADRKLIWISDFEKTGYTAPARILSQPELITNQKTSS